MNKATKNDAEYSKGPITGKALEAFNILKTMLCTELTQDPIEHTPSLLQALTQ
jgi:hypothetical protein